MVRIKYKVTGIDKDGKPIKLKGERALKPGETFTLDMGDAPVPAPQTPEIVPFAPVKA